MRNDDKELLERIVDSHGLAETLGMLAEVCDDKAEHLECTWQDEESARAWVRASTLIRRVQERDTIGRVTL